MANRINLLQGNIASTLTKLALPIMGMSFIQMAYNLTDVFWIGKLGAGAVASVGTGGQLIWFCTGIHMLAQVGGQVYVAQNLGANKPQVAAKFAHAALCLSVVISLVLGCIFLFMNQYVISFFQLNGDQVIIDAQNYLRISGGFVVFQLLSKMLTIMITATGNSKTPFIATTIGLVFNIVMDPILIFGWFGFPALGVIGAALATIMAQFIVFLVLLHYARKDKQMFSLINIKVLPDFNKCKQILRLSAPVATQATLFPLISMYISRLIAGFGDEAIAVQRIGSQIESLSWMTSDGFAIAVNSFVAQNFGANNRKRARQGFITALKILSIWGILTTIFMIVFARELFTLFLPDVNTASAGAQYLMILGTSQLFMCWEILSSNTMNALGRTKLPAMISILFTGLRIPMAIALSTTVLAINGVWWSISISSYFKGILLLVAVVLIMKQYTKQYEGE